MDFNCLELKIKFITEEKANIFESYFNEGSSCNQEKDGYSFKRIGQTFYFICDQGASEEEIEDDCLTDFIDFDSLKELFDDSCDFEDSDYAACYFYSDFDNCGYFSIYVHMLNGEWEEYHADYAQLFDECNMGLIQEDGFGSFLSDADNTYPAFTKFVDSCIKRYFLSLKNTKGQILNAPIYLDLGEKKFFGYDIDDTFKGFSSCGHIILNKEGKPLNVNYDSYEFEEIGDDSINKELIDKIIEYYSGSDEFESGDLANEDDEYKENPRNWSIDKIIQEDDWIDAVGK